MGRPKNVDILRDMALKLMAISLEMEKERRRGCLPRGPGAVLRLVRKELLDGSQDAESNAVVEKRDE